MPPWTPEEVESWIAEGTLSHERGLWSIADPAVREAWGIALRAWRAHLVDRAPECDDYQRLSERVFDALGRPTVPTHAPPTPDAQRAAVDRGLALLWARALAPEVVAEEALT